MGIAYTVRNSPEVEAKVAADLAVIRDAVMDCVGEDALHSILLTGGFGRGEGGVFLTTSGPRIANDYDLAVVPHAAGRLGFVHFYRRHHAALEARAARVARQLGVKQVDLTLRSLDYFRRPPELRVENYEVKHGHRLLLGAEDPCAAMPAWRPEDLPLFDGTWLFRNRGFGLLMARLYLWPRNELLPADRENFFIECNKAWLAMGDARLLLEHRYHHLHAERMNRAQAWTALDFSGAGDMAAGYRAALEWKLRPVEQVMAPGDPLHRWQELTDKFLDFFLHFESQRLGRICSSWLAYSTTPTPEDRLVAHTFAAELLRSGGWGAAMLKANRANNVRLVALLLASAGAGEARTDQLAAAGRLLGRAPQMTDDATWLDLTLATLRSVHPGGEVARLLRRFEPSSISHA